MSLEGQQLDRYRVVRLLGSGGMGEVYLAEDARIEQQVAIKVIRAEVSPYRDAQATQEAARLFQREAKAIAKLDHPHILPLFAYGEERIGNLTVIYLVMPYRQEGSLAAWLRKRSQTGLLSPQEAAHIVGQAASALQHAHDRQIIHQDVKPSNFLLRQRSETPMRPDLPDLFLADFGIARFSTATASASQSIRGTPTSMAPEQWEGHPVAATDQYALAVMAYELLTGRPPFQGAPGPLMYQHLTVSPPPPSTFNARLSRDIDTVLLRALAKKPEERFASVTAFANAFQQVVQDMQKAQAPTRIAAAPTSSDVTDICAVLAISAAEAQAGTTRTLTLPGGHKVTVLVPAGVRDGQLLRLEGEGEASPDGGEAGALILTILVAAAQGPPSLSTASATMTEETLLTTNPTALATSASTVSDTGQQPVVSSAARPEMSTPTDLDLSSTVAAPPASQESLPPTDLALPEKSPVGRPEETLEVAQAEQRTGAAPVEPPEQPPATVTPQPSQRGISRRTVVVGLAGLAVVGVTCGTLILLTSLPPKNGLRVLLVPATGTPTPAALSATQALLSQRLADFGLTNASVQELTTGNQPTLQVKVPHFGGDERGTLEILLNTGRPEFWNTGPTPVALGSMFDPTQFTQYNPKNQPQFTGADLDPSQIAVGTDQDGRPSILFSMKDAAVANFGSFTQSNVGNYLTVTLDRKVIESAVIQSAITGQGEITGNFTQQQATAIASVFKYPSLPVTLHIASESSF
jgi:tRNA A-37 threonylcarbamoyl transferase component Bud32